MKQLLSILQGILLAIAILFSASAPCDAENMALKRECESKASQAAELIRTLGAEAAFKKITDSGGLFVGEKSHVFCIDGRSGRLLAHKVARFVGSNMHYYMDADGNRPYSVMLEKVKQVENGWTRYLTYGSGPEKRETPGLKHMYFFKVPGETIVICCGYWEDA